MRTLTSTLEDKQQEASIPALYKVQLTLGVADDTFTQTRILTVNHFESDMDQHATIVLDNSDKSITAQYKGYKAVISYGMTTSSGDEFSACAPLWVLRQQNLSAPGLLTVTLTLIGIPNLMAMDKASVETVLATGNTDTLKTLLTAAVNKTVTAYDHTVSYSATFDSEDDLVDSFNPADSLQPYIAFNQSRLETLRRLLQFCNVAMRAEGDGKIHFLVPTKRGSDWQASTAYTVNDYVRDPTVPDNDFLFRCTTAGTSHTSQPIWPTAAGNTVTDPVGGDLVWTAIDFEYEYKLDVANEHNLYVLSTNDSLLIPNRVDVSSHPDADESFSGTAEDTESSDITEMEKRRFVYARVVSNAEADSIAAALLENSRRNTSEGSLLAPLNVGQEVHDIVKITDARSSDFDPITQIWNVSSLRRRCGGGRWEIELLFGALLPGGETNILALGRMLRPPEAEFSDEDANKLVAIMTQQIQELIEESGNNEQLILLLREIDELNERANPLSINISQPNHVTITAATYTVKDEDQIIGLKRAGTITVTLPSAAAVIPGRPYVFKDENGTANTNNYTIGTEGSETIDGASTVVISTNNGFVTVYSDGTNWQIL